MTGHSEGCLLRRVLVSLILLTCPGLVAAQDRPQSRQEFERWPVSRIESAYGLKALGSDSLAQLVRSEASRLSERSYPPGMQLAIRWTNEPSSYAHPEAGIAVSRTQIESYIAKLGPEWGWLVASFILAHERGHILQVRMGMAQNLSELDRELMADVLAGLYLVDRFPAIDISRINPGSAEANSYQASIQKLADLSMLAGGPGQFDGSPNPNQRVAAVRAGFSYASMRKSVDIGFFSREEFEKVNEVRPGETLFDWALAAGRRAAKAR